MKEINTTIGEREFTFYTLKAFDIIKHGARLKGALTKGVAADGLDASVMQALAGVNEHFVPDIIMPILKESVVVCTTDQRKIVTEADVNALYDEETIDEFFILIAEVLAANFGPALKKTLARFGIHLDQLNLKDLIANLSKSSGAPTSTTK